MSTNERSGWINVNIADAHFLCHKPAPQSITLKLCSRIRKSDKCNDGHSAREDDRKWKIVCFTINTSCSRGKTANNLALAGGCQWFTNCETQRFLFTCLSTPFCFCLDLFSACNCCNFDQVIGSQLPPSSSLRSTLMPVFLKPQRAISTNFWET